MFVLREKGSLKVICSAKTTDEIKKKVNDCYWNVRGMQPKGTDFSMQDFMENKVVSEVTIRNIILDDKV